MLNVLYGIHTVTGWENLLFTRKVDHIWFFQIPLILKAGFKFLKTGVIPESFDMSISLLFVKDSLI